MSWIRFRVRRERAMVSVIVLCSVSWVFKGTMAARMRTGEIFRHGGNVVKKEDEL